MSTPPVIIFGSHTDEGKRRRNNEDVSRAAWLGAGTPRASVLLVVSDGMGGAEAGEVASRLAADGAHEILAARLAAEEPPADRSGWIDETVRELDRRIRVEAEHPGRKGMGATLSLLWVAGGTAWWGQVGDSRIYLLHAGELRQLTKDQSPVGRLRASGEMTEEQARASPFRNLIDQCLGGGGEAGESGGPVTPFVPVTGSIAVAPGDVFLLCSDGLNDGLWDREIAERLSEVAAGLAPDEAARKMVNRSKEASGKDNITALIAAVSAAPEPAVAPAAQAAMAQVPGRNSRLVPGLIAALLLVLAGFGSVLLALRQARATAANAQTDQASLQSQLQQSNQQLTAAQALVASARADLANGLGADAAKTLVAERDRERETAANAEAARTTLQRQLQQTLTQLADNQAQLAAAKTELANVPAADAVKAQAAELEASRGRIATLQGDVTQLREQVATLSATPPPPPSPPDVATVEQKLTDANVKLNATLRSYTLQQAELDRLQQSLAEAEAGRADATKAADERAAALAGLQQDLTALRATAAGITGELASVREQLNLSQATAEAAVAENQALKTRLALAGAPTEPGRPSPPTVTFVEPSAAVVVPPPGLGNPEPPTPPAAEATGPRVHVVVVGDTLSSLAKKYYGSASRWTAILEANRDVIKNQNMLTVGATLRIP